jgi:CRISPR-associated protein Cas1
MGVEGSFSKFYFEHYFKLFPVHLHKKKRSKRPALDPVNAMLSYSYTMVYNLLTTKLYMAGFDPSISYLHTPFRSHYALSSDFMELFRDRVNAKVFEWFADGLLSTDDFSKKSGVWLKYESRKKLWKEMKGLLQSISIEADKEIALFRASIA